MDSSLGSGGGEHRGGIRRIFSMCEKGCRAISWIDDASLSVSTDVSVSIEGKERRSET